MPRPRWVLCIQAVVLRFLAGIGIFMSRLASPRPLEPTFERQFQTTTSPVSGRIGIKFYMPENWRTRKELSQRKFPVIINFHGGGFTIGTAVDDARWATALVEQVGAIVASVDYRLAPEFPFPTAVEDGVDAVLYVFKHAEELHIDAKRIGLSGFSAGANLSFTVPLMLNELTRPSTGTTSGSRPSMLAKTADVALSNVPASFDGPIISAIIAWYPPTDYSLTRAQRVETLERKDKQLSPVLYRLFDESYLHPLNLDLTSPFLSPLIAPRDMLEGLPQDIIIYTCEWDILKAEGERMRDRLQEVDKTVVYRQVDAVRHGWDKFPTRQVPFSVTENYRTACNELKRIFKAN